MNITLQQDDIKKAVKLFIERQGIHLHNKTLGIAFAMGRGENGLSATLTIDEIDVPKFSNEDDNIKQGPSAAVQEMVKLAATTVNTAPLVTAVAATPAVPVAIVDDVVEVPVTAPATKAEVLAAVPEVAAAVAAVATPETEAAAAEPVAEAKAAEAAPAVGAKASTSLFGN